jgi:hypothetical protein
MRTGIQRNCCTDCWTRFMSQVREARVTSNQSAPRHRLITFNRTLSDTLVWGALPRPEGGFPA